MSDQIETWRIQQFRNTTEHLLQEMGGKLRSTVTFSGSYTGKAVSPVNQVGETKARRKTTRNQDTPIMGVPLDRRWVYPVDWAWGDMIDDMDRVRLGIQPDGEYTKAGTMAMQRAEDEEILGSFFGTAKTGEEGGTTKSFPAANEVAADIVDPGVTAASTGLNHAKILKGREILAGNKVDLDMEEIYMIITEKEVTELFGYNTTTSIDFVDGKPVSTGKLPPLYGVKFIPFSSSYLKEVGLITSDMADLPMWVKSGMHLGSWKERTIKVGEDTGKSFNTRIYMCQTLGATRLQEGKVVRVKSDQS